jgi:hypothetical protein
MYVVNWQAVRPPVWILLPESPSDIESRPDEILIFIQNLCIIENVCHVSHAQYAARMREFPGCRFE